MKILIRNIKNFLYFPLLLIFLGLIKFHPKLSKLYQNWLIPNVYLPK